jgi:sporulation protein YlmC with PRC-barrel domain
MFLFKIFNLWVRKCSVVNATALSGKKIVTSDNYLLGEVEGIEVDIKTWTIAHLRVLLSKQAVNDLHLEPPILWDVVFSLPVSMIRESNENISLNVAFKEISSNAHPNNAARQ